MTGQGTRRRRNRQPQSNSQGDTTVIKYSSLGTDQTTAGGSLSDYRPYILGNATGLSSSSGPNICSYYSSGHFMPGTSIRWEPSVSFTTSGRMAVGFSDNPEVLAAFAAGSISTRAGIVKGLGSVISFPVWQETTIQFPNKLRRKQFDVNTSATISDVDTLDRSLQTAMMFVVDGVVGDIGLGTFWYHDAVYVEGVTNVLT